MQGQTADSLSPLPTFLPAPQKTSQRWAPKCLQVPQAFVYQLITSCVHLCIHLTVRLNKVEAPYSNKFAACVWDIIISRMQLNHCLAALSIITQVILVQKASLTQLYHFPVCVLLYICLVSTDSVDEKLLTGLCWLAQITSQMPNHPANSFYYPRLKELPPIASIKITRQSRSPDRRAPMSNHILPNSISPQRFSGKTTGCFTSGKTLWI